MSSEKMVMLAAKRFFCGSVVAVLGNAPLDEKNMSKLNGDKRLRIDKLRNRSLCFLLRRRK
jgi:hypothetical protein